MPKQYSYETIPKELAERMRYEKETGTFARLAFDESAAIRRQTSSRSSALRSPFVQDCDKILYCPFFNRYSDKTQVFPLYKNDDVSRRILHVLLVSRIARTIGSALNLNLNLIEAISLGHDIGHPPFAHSGEKYLDEIVYGRTGRRFSHNIHSVRVLDGIFPYNISLQTLIGIACHNGEVTHDEYHPSSLSSFDEFDELMEKCSSDRKYFSELIPSTLEGCVVRFADVIAYLGKDRQDADRCGFLSEEVFEGDGIGTINAEIVNNLEVNIITNSYGKPYIKMDLEHYRAMINARRDNYRLIYHPVTAAAGLDANVRPMMFRMYEKLYSDLVNENRSSPVFTQHIAYVNSSHYRRRRPYTSDPPDRIVTDYIASMTDDYFIDLYSYLFPDDRIEIRYRGYFE
ncbi:MAG: HD domain-containing protein [Clostridia bacterium]|nr:HD domain-containing protein [Clostridia bacterium]